MRSCRPNSIVDQRINLYSIQIDASQHKEANVLALKEGEFDPISSHRSRWDENESSYVCCCSD